MMLAGKKAAVTGGSKGIGASIALALAREGADVLLVGRNGSNLESMRSQILAFGRDCVTMQADVSDPGTAARFREAIDKFGGLDIFVNNAAFTIRKTLMESTYEDAIALFQANFFGAFTMTQTAADSMIAKGKGGAITMVTSINALSALPKQALYSCTKAALESMMKSLASELAPYNIRVNSVAPGAILTDMNDDFTPEKIKEVASKIAIGRVGMSEEIADVALFLCSDAARYMTGATIVADGGYLLR